MVNDQRRKISLINVEMCASDIETWRCTLVAVNWRLLHVSVVIVLIGYDIFLKLQLGWHPVAVVQYTFTHKQYIFLQWKIQQDAAVYQKFIIPYFKRSSTCFGRHTAHHQEPKTAQAASGFAYVEGCRTYSCWTLSGSVYATWQRSYSCWTLSGSVYATWQRSTTARPTTFHVCKTRGCLCSFRLLMMGGVPPETCWASFKIRNNKSFNTLLHLVGVFTERIVCLVNLE